jgi:hypothetical protein
LQDISHIGHLPLASTRCRSMSCCCDLLPSGPSLLRKTLIRLEATSFERVTSKQETMTGASFTSVRHGVESMLISWSLTSRTVIGSPRLDPRTTWTQQLTVCQRKWFAGQRTSALVTLIVLFLTNLQSVYCKTESQLGQQYHCRNFGPLRSSTLRHACWTI